MVVCFKLAVCPSTYSRLADMPLCLGSMRSGLQMVWIHEPPSQLSLAREAS